VIPLYAVRRKIKQVEALTERADGSAAVAAAA
jgi:hypothetical protein